MIEERPWGYFEVIAEADRCKVKRLVVYPGHATSLQRHHHREEIWVVAKGAAEFTVNGARRECAEGAVERIPPGSAHRIANPGKIDLEIIETQLGSYLGEDDIVRLSDNYGRADA